MKRYDTIYLIEESPTAHGIFDSPTETKYQVYAEIQNVGMNETYQLLNHHLQAEYTFVLANEDEYLQAEGCKIVEFKDKRYTITRVSRDNYDRIRLICSSQIKDRG